MANLLSNYIFRVKFQFQTWHDGFFKWLFLATSKHPDHIEGFFLGDKLIVECSNQST